MVHNKTKKIIAYALILGTYIYFSQVLLKNLYDIGKKTFVHWPYFYSTIFISIIFGILLGLGYIINEYKKQGRWNINIVKLLIIGIPSLFCTFYEPIYYLINIHPPLALRIIVLSESFEIFTGILFGYVLITSIYKKQEKL